MKKLLLSTLAIGTCYSLTSQVLYTQTFDNIPGPTAGGAGTYVFPANMQVMNVDNGTVDANVSYINEAWERREDFVNNVADSAAFSTSWNVPVVTANDWMWTPLIGPITSSTVLKWNAITYDPSYPDGYEVRVMSAGFGTPTGGTGAIGNMIAGSTSIFSISAENTTWTPRSVSLAAYAGQSIYIAFRNNSNNQFVLLIDDIVVESSIPYDAQLVSTDTITEYTQIPLAQAAGQLSFGGNVRNNGSSTLTNVVLNVNVTNSANASVYAASSSPIASLAAGASMDVTIPSFTPNATGTYTVRYNVSATEVDPVNTNDTLYDSFVITDTVYARDRGTATGGLGIGAGNGGYLGQQFTIITPADLTSITADYLRGYTGKKYAAVVWNMAAGLPSTIIASTDTLLYPDNNSLLTTIKIHGGPLTLAPGDYVVTAVEFDSTVQIRLTDNIFTPGTTWVNWPTSPLGGWANNEDFGGSFLKAYQLRANFGPICANTTGTDVQTACGSYTWIDGLTYTASNSTATHILPNAGGCDSLITLNLTINNLPILTTSLDGTTATITADETGATYQWIDCNNGNIAISGETNQSFAATANGNYAVIVTKNGCSDTSACVAVTTVGIRDNGNSSLIVSLYPNPNTGEFTIHLKETSTVVITDALGRVVMNVILNSGAQKINLSKEEQGVYFVKVSSKNGSTTKKLTLNR